MKYIIDIEEKPLCVFDKDTQTYFPRLWRVKGFNSLVFDEEGLNRLEVLNPDYINEHFGQLQDEAYQRGLEDGKKATWEAVRKVIHLPEAVVLDLFTDCYSSVCTVLQVFLKYEGSEVIAKLKAYEEKQKAEDEIKVGDEVRHDRGWTAVVTSIDNVGFSVMDYNGEVASYSDIGKFKKTGRHFDIDKILEDMRHD